MGCFASCLSVLFDTNRRGYSRDLSMEMMKPRRGYPWKSSKPVTIEELKKLREDFWFSTKGTEGSGTIWETLQAACEEKDDVLTDAILEAAGIHLENGSLEIAYDLRGSKYEIPIYCIRDPENLIT
eukprot:TRINITY_DN2382_c0_g1_i2.p1 TRINITY_DN2382_c0_g1~~TRINITY_DN2382_c0_g1_i2.p1  ORF type:complete len:126 (-),score=15.44 TRINITY_DN2382_c0_g1_i2:106-483(-)